MKFLNYLRWHDTRSDGGGGRKHPWNRGSLQLPALHLPPTLHLPSPILLPPTLGDFHSLRMLNSRAGFRSVGLSLTIKNHEI